MRSNLSHPAAPQQRQQVLAYGHRSASVSRSGWSCALAGVAPFAAWLGAGVLLLGVVSCTVPPAAEGEPSAPTESSAPLSTPRPDVGTEPDVGTGSEPLSQTSPSRGQRLPITAKANLADQEILLEVAETPEQQAMGLMFRPALPDDRGMLFPMAFPRPVSFWMMNVPVPLDMVFIYQGKVQGIAANVPPCQAAPCPTYGPGNQLVDHVIELRGGRAAELGLAVGDPVTITRLEQPVTP